MTAAVLTLGTEITRGELVNTNEAFLAEALTSFGFHVVEIASVDDDEKRIQEAVGRLLAKVDVLVCTGGLGPTTDDRTTESVAHFLGVPLVRDEASVEAIRRRFERLGRTMSPTNEKQAFFPEGAEILPNRMGTAPGFCIQKGSHRAYFLPGVPREMRVMFQEQVAPRVRPHARPTSHQIRLRTFGWPESVVGERLAGVEEKFPGVILGYRAHFPEIEVKVLAEGDDERGAKELCARASEEVRHRLGEVLYGEGDDTFAGAVGRALSARGRTLAIAESCTGGLVGAMLTSQPGASEFLLVDAVTYANNAKTRLLGVQEEVLRGHGAVSGEVAAAMAEGVRRLSGADVALAITGTAGPGGGTDAVPVGTVFLAVASADGTRAERKQFAGERSQIQTMAAYTGLRMVAEWAASLG